MIRGGMVKCWYTVDVQSVIWWARNGTVSTRSTQMPLTYQVFPHLIGQQTFPPSSVVSALQSWLGVPEVLRHFLYWLVLLCAWKPLCVIGNVCVGVPLNKSKKISASLDTSLVIRRCFRWKRYFDDYLKIFLVDRSRAHRCVVQQARSGAWGVHSTKP